MDDTPVSVENTETSHNDEGGSNLGAPTKCGKHTLTLTESEHLRLSNQHQFTFRKLSEMPTWLPRPWVRRGVLVDDDYHDTYENVIAYHLNWYQRMFVCMEYPNCCRSARLYQ